MDEPAIRHLTPDDRNAVMDLYRAVSSMEESGLAREADEIDADYVRMFLEKAGRNGVTLGAFLDERLVGEIHAARLGPRQFDHVLSDLTVAVHPEAQGRGVGSRLFAGFFASVADLSPTVTRIELMVRAGNAHAIRLYERLGFVAEGRFAGRVRLRGGRIEDDIAMARRL